MIFKLYSIWQIDKYLQLFCLKNNETYIISTVCNSLFQKQMFMQLICIRYKYRCSCELSEWSTNFSIAKFKEYFITNHVLIVYPCSFCKALNSLQSDAVGKLLFVSSCTFNDLPTGQLIYSYMYNFASIQILKSLVGIRNILLIFIHFNCCLNIDKNRCLISNTNFISTLYK